MPGKNGGEKIWRGKIWRGKIWREKNGGTKIGGENVGETNFGGKKGALVAAYTTGLVAPM